VSGWDHAYAKAELSEPNGGAFHVQTDLVVIDTKLLTPEPRAVLKQALLEVNKHGATAA
jgi:hypothetical protein